MHLLNLYAESAANPRFKVISREAKVRIGDALGAWLLILEEAGAHNGEAGGLNLKIIEAVLNLKPGKAEQIIQAMQEFDMLDGMFVKNWRDRQGQPTIDCSRNGSKRQRKCLAKKQSGALATQSDALATKSDTVATQNGALATQNDTPVTKCDTVATQNDTHATQSDTPVTKSGTVATQNGAYIYILIILNIGIYLKIKIQDSP